LIGRLLDQGKEQFRASFFWQGKLLALFAERAEF
jgi:hypothetical protein